MPDFLFADSDGDPLEYGAVLATGGGLPGWLSFDPNARSLSGTPGVADTGSIDIALGATDPYGLFASEVFHLDVML